MLRTIIIDDELPQRQNIEQMVQRYCPELKIVATADGVKSGTEAIRKHEADLVLLDINLKDGTGFDLLNNFQPIHFKVIFITAYDQYAIKAFRFSALDYLLKPVDVSELCQAVKKATESLQKDFNIQLDHLRSLTQSNEKTQVKLIIRTFDNIHLVPVKDIIFCESDNNYTRFHLSGKKQIMVSVTLKDYEEILSDSGFFRVHRKFLINMKHISRFEKTEAGKVVLGEDIKIPVSARKRVELLTLLDQMTYS